MLLINYNKYIDSKLKKYSEFSFTNIYKEYRSKQRLEMLYEECKRLDDEVNQHRQKLENVYTKIVHEPNVFVSSSDKYFGNITEDRYSDILKLYAKKREIRDELNNILSEIFRIKNFFKEYLTEGDSMMVYLKTAKPNETNNEFKYRAYLDLFNALLTEDTDSQDPATLFFVNSGILCDGNEDSDDVENYPNEDNRENDNIDKILLDQILLMRHFAARYLEKSKRKTNYAEKCAKQLSTFSDTMFSILRRQAFAKFKEYKTFVEKVRH